MLHRGPVPVDQKLVDHLVATTGLTRAEAARVAEDVLAYHQEPVEAYVRRRHAELKTHGVRNPEIFGRLADRYGRRRVLGITITATLVGYGLSAFALASRDYPLFVLSRFATGLTEGNVAVVRALLADWHPQLERTRSFAWLNASLYIGWLVGPLLGGLTLPWGEAVPFIVAAVVLVPCLVLLGVGLPDDRPAARPQGGLLAAMRRQQSLGLVVQDPVLRHLALLQLAYTLGVNALYEFAPLWMLQQAGLGSRGIALVTAERLLPLGEKLGEEWEPVREAADALDELSDKCGVDFRS